jgi:hypothetical protein
MVVDHHAVFDFQWVLVEQLGHDVFPVYQPWIVLEVEDRETSSRRRMETRRIGQDLDAKVRPLHIQEVADLFFAYLSGDLAKRGFVDFLAWEAEMADRSRSASEDREAARSETAEREAEPSVFGAEGLLTPGEVARLFRVSAKTVLRWSKAGRFGSVRTLVR